MIFTVTCVVYRVGQNLIYTPYMTVCMVISLLNIPYIRIYVWFWPTLGLPCGLEKAKDKASSFQEAQRHVRIRTPV